MTSNWIKIKRENKNISQYKMAKALNITSQQLSAWERNKTIPDNESIQLINNFFKSPEKFFKENGVSIKKQTFKRNLNDQGISRPQKKIIQDFYECNAPKSNNINKNKKAIMLFSGIGGMSEGFRSAGFNLIGHVEINPSARKIYAQNFPDSKFLGDDITKISDEKLRSIKSEEGEISVIAGGPPCQGFSLAGKRNVFDPRNQLFKEFVRFAKILQPKVVLLENVKMLLTMQTQDGNLVKDYLLQEFSKAGYQMIYSAINAKDYGVPQSRERVVFLGVRKDLYKNIQLTFPSPTHTHEKNLFDHGLKPIKTFKEATEDLDLLESGEASKTDPWHFSVKHPDHVIKMLKIVPEGKSAHENKDPKLRPSSGYNTTYKRIRWNEPSSTISTNFSMISGSRNVHPTSTRSLTIREAMRCQTFPDSYQLSGTLGEIRKGIGNAVPPKLAKFFAGYIMKHFLSDKNNQPLD